MGCGHMPRSVEPADTTTPMSAVGRRDVRRAWVSLALLPAALVLAMLLGEWLLSLQGFDGVTGEGPPLAAVLRAGGPAVLVLIAPGVAAFCFGLRARRHGEPAGLTPAIIGAVT